jgi:hypothetical protein
VQLCECSCEVFVCGAVIPYVHGVLHHLVHAIGAVLGLGLWMGVVDEYWVFCVFDHVVYGIKVEYWFLHRALRNVSR